MPFGIIDTQVVRVRRPATIADPKIAALIGRAIQVTEFPVTSPQELYYEWAGRISADDFGLFIGMQDGAPKAVAVIVLPISHSMIAPQCLLAYSEGRPDLARKIALRVRVWLMENGLSTLLGLNMHREDDVFIRGFRAVGRGRKIGSLIEFRL